MVSIVVAAKNALPRLQRLMVDLRLRGAPDAELVIVDGASSDGTPEWLASKAKQEGDVAFQWHSEADTGIAEAWNRGVRIASAEWIVFLGADDFVGDTSAWQQAVDILARLPATVAAAAFPVEIISKSKRLIQVVKPSLGRNNRDIFAENTIPHQGVFHRRCFWERFGPFDESFPVACDYELLVRALRQGATVTLVDSLPPVRMTFGGASKHDALRNLLEFRRAQRNNGISGPRLRWWLAWIRAILRRGVGTVMSEPTVRRLADRLRRIRGLPRVWTNR